MNTPKIRTLLYFGSFDPIHAGHTAVAEYAVAAGLCDLLALVVSPQNPLKEAAGQSDAMVRFEMAEIACAESRYPGQIRPSVIEFLLPRPSYTVDTLRHLRREYPEQEFSVLMGGDLVEQLSRWKEYREILRDYKIYVYPRGDGRTDLYPGSIEVLEEAPRLEISSTMIRERRRRGLSIEGLVSPGVQRYIEEKGLWMPEK